LVLVLWLVRCAAAGGAGYPPAGAPGGPTVVDFVTIDP